MSQHYLLAGKQSAVNGFTVTNTKQMEQLNDRKLVLLLAEIDKKKAVITQIHLLPSQR